MAERRAALVFDTETTGLIDNGTLALARQPEVIEFYGCVVDLDTGELIDEVDHLIRPARMPLPHKIVNITGITDEMLEGKPAFAWVADEIFELIERSPMAIAHNASYDQEILDFEARRLSRTIKWPRLVCTVEQTVAIKGVRLSLSDLHQELFGEAFEGAHRAREDVAALVRCVVELDKRGWL